MITLTPTAKKILFLLGVLGLFTVLFVLRFLYGINHNAGYSPDQPIPYSHKIHAGDNKIPCLYCHSNADNSRYATVPGLSICMNCHTVVKPESPLIQQIAESYKKNEPIQWIKVHDLPDFVLFNHKRHVKKDVACAVCHGDVASEVKVQQLKSLTMGFCVDCHRVNKAPIDCSTCHQ